MLLFCQGFSFIKRYKTFEKGENALKWIINLSRSSLFTFILGILNCDWFWDFPQILSNSDLPSPDPLIKDAVKMQRFSMTWPRPSIQYILGLPARILQMIAMPNFFNTVWASVAAIMNDHRYNDLKQHKLLFHSVLTTPTKCFLPCKLAHSQVLGFKCGCVLVGSNNQPTMVTSILYPVSKSEGSLVF